MSQVPHHQSAPSVIVPSVIVPSTTTAPIDPNPETVAPLLPHTLPPQTTTIAAIATPPKPRILTPVKPPRIIHEHFDIATYKIDHAHGYVEADCQHCGATIKGQRNVTSNFIQHMRRRHPHAYHRFATQTPRAKRPRIRPPPPPPPPPDLVLENALVSATYRAAKRTDCHLATTLSDRIKCTVYLKREDTQIAGSVSFRASYNYLANTPTSRAGVVTSGITALATATAANMHGKPCLVIHPSPVPPPLSRLLTQQSAKLDTVPCQDPSTRASELNRTYVDPTTGDLPDAVAGYATLALEILQQSPHASRLFAPPNTLLLQGLHAVLQRLGRDIRLTAVVTDSTIVNDWSTYADTVIVSQEEICSAVRTIFEDTDVVLEPIGAIAVAGCIKTARAVRHQRMVCIVDSPLRDFNSIRDVANAVEKDGRCLLVVQKRDCDSLSPLMRELAGTAGGRVRLTCVRYSGWPVLLGLECDDTVTGAQHVANLTSLGYRVADVSSTDLSMADMAYWGGGTATATNASIVTGATGANGNGDSKWGVFKVVLPVDQVIALLGRDGVGRVSYEWDGRGDVARVLIGVVGEWCLGNLDELGGVVSRMREGVPGIRLLGCELSDADEEGVVEDIGIGFEEQQREIEVEDDGAGEAVGESDGQTGGGVTEGVAEGVVVEEEEKVEVGVEVVNEGGVEAGVETTVDGLNVPVAMETVTESVVEHM